MGSTDYKSIRSTIKYYVTTGKYRFRGNVTWFADVPVWAISVYLAGLAYPCQTLPMGLVHRQSQVCNSDVPAQLSLKAAG